MKNKIHARKRRGLKTKAIYKANPNKPKLVIYRSNVHIYSQIVVPGDAGDQVIVSASTMDKELKSILTDIRVDQAKQVGALLAKRAQKKDISRVAFDRSGYKYHGRLKALADGAREAGLIF